MINRKNISNVFLIYITFFVFSLTFYKRKHFQDFSRAACFNFNDHSDYLVQYCTIQKTLHTFESRYVLKSFQSTKQIPLNLSFACKHRNKIDSNRSAVTKSHYFDCSRMWPQRVLSQQMLF